MTSIAIYVPENREIDLSALSPCDYEMVKGLHGVIHRGQGVLLCKRARGDREMHVYKLGDHYFARHFSGGAHGEHRISRISDEHLRGTDAWLRAWSDAGFSTATEVSTDNHVRLDAVAFGGRITALETQVQPQSAAVVKGRHTKRLRARSFTGEHARPLAEQLQVVWFAPVGRPDWLYKVPTVQCQNRSWETTPDPHRVPAIGVRSIEVKPCSSMWFPRCPYQRGWCGQLHLWARPREGLSIADVAAMVPVGDLTPVRLPNGIYLTDRVGYARCKNFGYSAPVRPPPSPAPRAPACEWDGHERPAAVPAEPERAEQARESRAQALAEMMRKARERQEALTRQAEQARESCLRYDREIRRRERQPAHCDVPGCTTPGRPYPGGFRCDQHKPRPYLPADQGDGTG